MEKFGFVGLPNAGKSSLYNALTGGSALAAPYAFATTDPNVGVAKVPDQRLDLLTVMSKSKSSVPASVQFTDIGGLVEGASKGEGLGNQFLANIREVDAIVYVLRSFEDEDVPGTSDPLEQLRVLEIELTLADLEAVEKHATKRIKAARLDKSLIDEVEALEEALETLGEGTPLYRGNFSADKLALLTPYFLLTSKPVMAIVNVGEDIERDRVYLPLDELEKNGIQEIELDGKVVLNKTWEPYCYHYARRARTYLEEARQLLPLLPRRTRYSPAAMIAFYDKILRQIEKEQGDVFTKRVKLNKLQKMSLAAAVYVRHRMLPRILDPIWNGLARIGLLPSV